MSEIINIFQSDVASNSIKLVTPVIMEPNIICQIHVLESPVNKVNIEVKLEGVDLLPTFEKPKSIKKTKSLRILPIPYIKLENINWQAYLSP